MNILTLSLTFAIFCLFCVTTTNQQQEYHNVTHWAKSREKRFLIWPTQAVHKFIISLSLNIELSDKKAWRSLSGAWNFQWQHNLPLTVLYWWNSTYFPVSGRAMLQGRSDSHSQPTDLTATYIYAIVEQYMNNKGVNGRECLQRAICENAQVHYVGGVLDRIYQRLLTPERSMEQFYKDSYTIGSKGADCYKTYFGCPKGKSMFDSFVYIEDIK